MNCPFCNQSGTNPNYNGVMISYRCQPCNTDLIVSVKIGLIVTKNIFEPNAIEPEELPLTQELFSAAFNVEAHQQSFNVCYYAYNDTTVVAPRLGKALGAPIYFKGKPLTPQNAHHKLPIYLTFS